MTSPDHKADLHRYLQSARDALLWKLEGLSEYDIRRPLTPTGTNLLGLVKHVATMELGYLGDVFGRPSGEPLPWLEDGAEPNADMWVTADESREHIVGLYRRAWAHADATIDALPLETTGRVPWWPKGRDEVTLHHAVVRVMADAQRHAGHADGVPVGRVALCHGGPAPRRRRSHGLVVVTHGPDRACTGPPPAAGRGIEGRPPDRRRGGCHDRHGSRNWSRACAAATGARRFGGWAVRTTRGLTSSGAFRTAGPW